MCGIGAIWGNDEPTLMREIMDSLAHRGPDADGTSSSEWGTLGHRRLSIMDPDRGDQPMKNEDESLAIVMNGEIYNFLQLRQQLAGRHCFTTSSDSEVPLHLYEDIGSGTAVRLDGMFAFLLADGAQLYAARDTVGIKPLYYGRVADTTVFASELKAFPKRATDVREFPPGCLYDSRGGFHRFRALPKAEPEDRSPEHWCDLIRATLEASVAKRLMSDVPLGAFLSGGLDSSIIAALARRHMGELHTFSVGIEGSRDLEAARIVARHLDTIHHEYVFTEREVVRHLPEIVFSLESFDQDLVRSAVPCYFVSRLAAEYVKVILTGEGADELFGGYSYYKQFDGDMQLHEELYRSVASLHNINLQRVDRLTMAHSIEGRVPFLDLEMIELGQRIASSWKILHLEGGRRIEKWILRKAVEDLLPAEIVWRTKEQFDEGSGSAEILARASEYFMPIAGVPDYEAAHRCDRIRSHEESVYHDLLMRAYPNPSIVLANVARWGDGRINGPASEEVEGEPSLR